MADETRPHEKYTGMVYLYIPNSFGSSNPRWTHHVGLYQTRVSAIIIYRLHENDLSVYFPLFSV